MITYLGTFFVSDYSRGLDRMVISVPDKTFRDDIFQVSWKASDDHVAVVLLFLVM